MSSIPLRSTFPLPPQGVLYLVSALLVLAGGWLTLYSGAAPRTIDLRAILGTEIAYGAALALVIVALRRAPGARREVLVLGGVLLLFALDALFVQHLYGWTSRDGRVAGIIGAACSLAIVVAAAILLGMPLLSRPIAVLASAILVSRLAPAILETDAPVADLAPRHVALGWLVAACVLPALLLPASSAAEGLPARSLDLAATAAGLAAAALHFSAAGISFDLPLHAAYFAPFLVLLGPAVERVAMTLRAAWARTLAVGLPWLGLMLAATSFPPALVDRGWAASWPLTPFTLTLLLLLAVQAARAAALRSAASAHLAVALAAAAVLGGDLPEILAAARYPKAWQAVTVMLLVAATLAALRRPLEGMLLAACGAFVLAGSLAQSGMPWAPVFVALIPWGPLVLGGVEGGALSLRASTLLALLATAIPGALALAAGDVLRLGLALGSAAALALLGIVRREARLRRIAIGVAGGVLAGWPLSFQAHGEIRPGILLLELGFVVLLAAFAASILRSRAPAAPRPGA